MSDLIHRFFSFNERSLTSLANNTLWFATIDSFNDPFEGKVRLDFSIKDITKCRDVLIEVANRFGNESLGIPVNDGENISDALIRYLFDQGEVINVSKLEGLVSKSLTPLIDTAKNFVEKMRSEYGYCCFIQDYEERNTLTDTLMWGHYGDGLRGFVLSFEQSSIFEDIGNVEGDFYIGYANDPHEINIFDLSHCYLLEEEQQAVDRFLPIFLTKTEPWVYEQEIRFLKYHSGLQEFNPESLKYLTVGEKMSKYNLNLLKQLLSNYPNVKVQTAKTKDDSYKIVIN